MAALVMVSTFGCLNGMILAGPRLYYAMARDGLFFRAAGRLSPRTGCRPGAVAPGRLGAGLTLTGTTGAAGLRHLRGLLFYVVTVAGVFRLRATRPDLPRPYRAPLYRSCGALRRGRGRRDGDPARREAHVHVAGLAIVAAGSPCISWSGSGSRGRSPSVPI